MKPEPLKDKLQSTDLGFKGDTEDFFYSDDIRSACDWLKSQSLILQNGDILVISRFDLENAFADVYK